MAKRKKPGKLHARASGTSEDKSVVDRSLRAADDLGKDGVAKLRRELDAVDREILAAMNQRARLAQQIGEIKQSGSESVYDPVREAEVLQRATNDNPGPLGGESIRAIYRELISASRAIQARLRVAYLGPEFTFSHLAAIERFGQSAELMPVGTIAAVFEEVERGQAEFGVVPMENSTDGRVSDTLDCFSRSHVRICGELPLRIHHCLLGNGARDEIRTVYSKPQPLSQCRNWLARHLPQAVLHEVASTGEAAKLAKEDRHSAAVASAQAGVNYSLAVLAKDIEDQTENLTRFAVIGRETGPRTGNDKTALMLEIAHQPGALADVMAVFKRNRLNMTWIESFPIPGSRGRYLFFIEFVGHQQELRARRAVATLAKKAQRLEILGSYAQTEPIG
jgi:chorismate mutase/prephenate dehydratase